MAETVVYAILLPFAVSASIAYSAGRLPLPSSLKQTVLPLAIASAITASWAMLPHHPPWIPKHHWHWIPAIAWLMTALSPLTSLGAGSRSIRRHADATSTVAARSDIDRRPVTLEPSPAANAASCRTTTDAVTIHRMATLAVVLLAASVTAWLLVPQWKSLSPPRALWLPFLASYLALLGIVASRPLRDSMTIPFAWANMTIAAVIAIVLIAMFVSVTYASFASATGSAMAGCWLVLWRRPELRASALGLALSYATLIGGWAFIGCVEPRSPAWSFLAIPWSGVSAAAWTLERYRHGSARLRSVWWHAAIAFMLQFIIMGIVIFRIFCTPSPR